MSRLTSITLHRLSFAGATLLCLALPISAQNSPRGWSLDATIGLGKGWGGEYFARTTPAAELMIALPHQASRFVGLTLGAQPTLPGGDICHFNAAQTRCVDRFPGTFHFGGSERASTTRCV